MNMDSKYKAWQLARALYWHMKINGMSLGLIEDAIKNSEPFERVGTDQRTRNKYFDLMWKYGYVVASQTKNPTDGQTLYVVPETIDSMKPKSLGEYIKELEARANGKPIPEQKTLDAQT